MPGAVDTIDVDQRYLIINADDCGLTEGVTSGILEAYAAKIVTATSVMVTTPGAGDALTRLARVSIDVGLHVDLVAGAPLTNGPTLVDRRTSRFRPLSQLALRAAAGQLDDSELAEEMLAQLRRLTDAGLRVTHLDSHRHIHVLPPVWRAITAVAARAGNLAIRVPRDRVGSGGGGPGRSLARVALSVATRISAGRTPPAAAAVVGISLHGLRDFKEGLLRVLDRLPSGYTECIVHPGYVGPRLAALDSYTIARECELAALLSPSVRARLRRDDITLTSFPSNNSASMTHHTAMTGTVLSA